MFAVITSPPYWKEIEQVIINKEEQILYKKIDNEIDIISELEKINLIPVKYLIVDVSAIEDHNRLVQAIRRYRIKKDSVQIIIIAPGCLPGNETMSLLVSMGVYDIILPKSSSGENELLISSQLLEVLEKPTPYSKAVKWDVGAPEGSLSTQSNEKAQESGKTEKTIKEIKERTVTVIKDKIIGTVVIAIAGTMQRIGTTHTAISIAKFLAEQKFKVAIIEMHNSSHFKAIKNAYEDVKVIRNKFLLGNIHFYPYSESLNILDVLQEEYQYIVMDMGIYNQCNIDEFKRSNIRVVVSGVKDWELSELEHILRSGDAIFKNYYLFNYSDKILFKEIKSNMDQLKCFLAPYNPNPFLNSKECIAAYKDLLKGVLPEMKQTDTSKQLLGHLRSMVFRQSGKKYME